MHRGRGFTLIELLIVVAIIAILAAIAVPNFLEAQTRAKVSRVKADLRSVATAVEAYAVDWNTYPLDAAAPQFRMEDIVELSTPVAYITAINIRDPFNMSGMFGGNALESFQYYNCGLSPKPSDLNWGDSVLNNMSVSGAGALPPRRLVALSSWGPDRADTGFPWITAGFDFLWTDSNGSYRGADRLYDPTNGTVSAGDVGRLVGDTQGMPQQP